MHVYVCIYVCITINIYAYIDIYIRINIHRDTCHNQGTNCKTKWAVYVIMCDVCGMQYIVQTSNIRLRMNGHISDYRRFINGDFSKSDTSSHYSHLKSHDLKFSSSKYWKFLKMKVLNILQTFAN